MKPMMRTVSLCIVSGAMALAGVACDAQLSDEGGSESHYGSSEGGERSYGYEHEDDDDDDDWGPSGGASGSATGTGSATDTSTGTGTSTNTGTGTGTTPSGAPASHTDDQLGVMHGVGKADPLTSCTSCHGPSLTGGSGPSCYSCHDNSDHTSVRGGVAHRVGSSSSCTACHGPNDSGGLGPACSTCH